MKENDRVFLITFLPIGVVAARLECLHIPGLCNTHYWESPWPVLWSTHWSCFSRTIYHLGPAHRFFSAQISIVFFAVGEWGRGWVELCHFNVVQVPDPLHELCWDLVKVKHCCWGQTCPSELCPCILHTVCSVDVVCKLEYVWWNRLLLIRENVAGTHITGQSFSQPGECLPGCWEAGRCQASLRAVHRLGAQLQPYSCTTCPTHHHFVVEPLPPTPTPLAVLASRSDGLAPC